MKLPLDSERVGLASLRIIAVLVLLLVPLVLLAQAPQWWTERSVTNGNSANDYAAVNQGQVKNIATKAVAEFNEKLADLGGAGDALNQLAITLSKTSSSTNDYAAVNLGQLKAVAKPFFDRLLEVQYTGRPLESGTCTYPWANREGTANDYAMANIGQVKNLFSFDLSSFTLASSLVPQITSPADADLVVSAAFSYTIAATQSPTAYNATSLDGSALPAGLCVNNSTGVISGTLSNAGLYCIKISATNQHGTGSGVLVINVASSGSAPVINSSLSAVATTGVGFAYMITASNSPTSFAAANLPSNLLVDSVSGIISGTVTTSGTYNVNISVANAAGSGSATLMLAVSTNSLGGSGQVPAITGSLSSSGTMGQPFSYTITATNSPTSYSASGLPSGLSVDGTSGVVSGTATVSGTYTLIIAAGNQNGTSSASMQMVIIDPTIPTITSAATASGAIGMDFYYQITANNNPAGYSATGLPSGLSLNQNTGDITGIPTQSGNFAVAISGTGPNGVALGNLIVNIDVAKPVITSDTTASVMVENSFFYQISAGNSPTSYSASGLPAGLEINPTSGNIVGVPTVPGVYPILLTASNAIGSSTATLTLTVSVNGPAIPVFTGRSIVYSAPNIPFSQTLSMANFPTSFSATGLPQGFTIDAASGVISGTTSGTAGTYLINLTGSNSVGTGTAQMLLVVESATSVVSSSAQLQTGVSPMQTYATTSAVIKSSTSDTTVADTSFPGLSVGNSSSDTIQRGLLGVDLSMLPPDATVISGSLTLYATSYGSYASSVEIYQPSVPFYEGAATWTLNNGYDSNLRLASTQVTGSAGYYTWVSGTNFVSAMQGAVQNATMLNLVLLAPTAEANISGTTYYYTFATASDSTPAKRPSLYLNYTTAAPPVVIPGQSSLVTTGTATSFRLPILHSPTAISAVNLPAGLLLNGTTGVVSGTATTSGTYVVNLSATNANGSGTGALTMIVGGVPNIQTSGTITSGTEGAAYSYTFATSNGAATYSLTNGSLPNGLSLNSATGIISGTISATSTYSRTFTITATNQYGSSSKAITLNVAQVPPVFGIIPDVSGNQSLGFNYYPFQYVTYETSRYSATGLPPGLSISQNGTISGTPSITGTFAVTVTATNAVGSGSTSFAINVLPPPAVRVSDQSASASVNNYFSTNLNCTVDKVANASYPSYSFSTSGLPAGLSINNSGEISGTATTTGTYFIPITASYIVSAGAISGTGTLKLTIFPPGPIISSALTGTAYVGNYYSYGLYANNNPTSTSATGMPDGLTFADGYITGTASASGIYNINLTAANTDGTNSATLVLTVIGQPTITSSTVTIAQVGVPFNYLITGSNNPTNFSSTSLPAGLSLNGSSGIISGTPVAADMVSMTLTGGNGAGQTSAPLLMIVTANPMDTVASFQQGAAPVSSYTVPFAAINSSQPDLSSTSSNVIPVGIVSGTSASRGLLAFDLSSLPDNASVTSAQLVVTASGTNGLGAPVYVEVHQASSPFSAATANWSNNNAYSLTPLSYATIDTASPSTSNFYGLTAFTSVVQQVYSNSGTLYLSLLAPSVESGSTANYVGLNAQASDPTKNPKLVVTYTLTSGTSAPVITSAAMASGTVNAPFGFTLTATNLPSSFGVSALPSGLSLSASTGVISGTATQVSSTVLTSSATNAIGTGTKAMTINIDSGIVIDSLSIVSGANQYAVAGLFAAQPLIVQALKSGTAVPSTLVTFSAQSGMGLLSSTNTGLAPAYSTLTVPTDASGKATAWLQMPQTLGVTSIKASAGTSNPVVFLENTVASTAQSGTDSTANDVPVLSVVSGANQSAAAGHVLSSPFVVQAVDHLGGPVSSLGLSFNVVGGGATISPSSSGAWQSALNLSTDGSGQATIYLCTGTGPLNQVSCTTSSSTSTVYLSAYTQSGSSGTTTAGGSGTPTTDLDPPALGVPMNVYVTPTDYYEDPSEVIITWGAAANADGYLIQEQISGGKWNNLGTAGAKGGSYTASGLYAEKDYQFRVIATRDSYQSQPSATASYSFPLVRTFIYQFRRHTHDYYLDGDENKVWCDYTSDWYEVDSNYSYNWYAYDSWTGNYRGSNGEYTNTSEKYKFILNHHQPSDALKWTEVEFLTDDDSVIAWTPKTWTGSSNETGVYSVNPSTSTNTYYVLYCTPQIIVYNNAYGNTDKTEKKDNGVKIAASGAQGQVPFEIPYLYGAGEASATISFSSSYFEIYNAYGNKIGDTLINDAYKNQFYVRAKDNTPNGVYMIITVTFKDLHGAIVATDTCKFVYQGQTPDYSLPIDESSGPKYRKIAMNGLPMPDEKPQHSAETDQEKEETFVDALTLGLRHSTTDAYLPVNGSDFSVSARRDFRSEVWNNRSGLRPHEQPDRPFGICWSSNLAPNIHFTNSGNPNKTEPDKAYVTDETGAVHTFFIWSDGGVQQFFPMPTAKNEQTPNLESLVANSGGSSATYTFTRKYGATLTFEMTPLNLSISEDRVIGSPYSDSNTYARLKQATDRLGNTIYYQFQGANNLIPATITVANQPDTKLSIQQAPASSVVSGVTSTQPLITAIWDAKGNRTSFSYQAAGSGDSNACELVSVVAPDGAITRYTYNLAQESDATPHLSTDPGKTFWHADIASIADPLGNTYQFTYNIDNTKLNYMADPDIYTGYYTQSGLPRNIAQITLPDDHTATHPEADVTTFVNDSKVWVEFSGGTPIQKGQRHVKVTDATGFTRTYRFEDAQVVPLPKFKKYYNASNFTDSKVVCYQTMSIDYGTLGSETYTFDIGAGMAVSSIKDFSGNTTIFVHGDAWTDSLSSLYRNIMTDTTVNGYYGDPTSQINALGKTKSFTYTAGSRIMSSVTDEEGRETAYKIDNLGRRTQETIIGTSGTIQVTDFEYGNKQYPGFQTKKTVEKLSGDEWAQSALVTQFVPDANGRVAQQIIDPDGLHLVTSYTYDANGNKLSVTDPKGNTTWFTYDSRNRLVYTTFADGTLKQIAYDDSGNKVSETDENGNSTLYGYDKLNRLTQQTRSMNGTDSDLVTSYKYNAANSKISTTDPNHNTTTMDYDSIQRLVKTTDALSNSTNLEYGTNSGGNGFDTSAFKPTRSIDPRGVITDVSYDALYRPLVKTVKDASGAVIAATSTQYDNVGNAILITDALGHQTATQYDALNRPVKTTHPDSTFTQTFYTSTGLKWKVQDENWRPSTPLVHITRTQYDGAGRATAVLGSQVDDGAGNLAIPTTSTYYDAAGNIAATVNPLGFETDYAYDARNRKIREFRPAALDIVSGGTTSSTLGWAYDAAGRATGTLDARGNWTHTAYDPANRVTDVTAPAVLFQSGTTSGTATPITHSTYDRNGNVLTVTDPNGHTTTNTYDALNRLLNTTDAAGNTVSYQYDQVGNRTKVTDGKNQSTTFAYDALNRNTVVTDALGRSTQFRYDALNKTQRIDAAKRITNYLYDTRNRLTNVVYASTDAANATRTYTYDDVGNMLTVSEPAKSGVADVAYLYDGLNRVVSETSNGKTHAYSYDLAGNRTKAIYGGNSRTLVSTYDPLNRLSTVTESGRTTSYAYDLDGNIAQKVLPNGDKETATFDALNRTKTQTAVSGANESLYQYTYGHDLAGNVSSVGETYPSGLNNRTVTNNYDGANRLVSEAVSGSNATTTSYSYDAANNRTSKIVTGGSAAGTTSYNYNALNQLTSYSSAGRSVALTYDAAGNRTRRVVSGTAASDAGTDSYSYDFENRLISVTKTAGSSGTYAYSYDYRTRRVVRDETNAGGVQTNIVFSGGVSVQEYAAGSTYTAVEYIRGNDYGGGVGGILYTLRGSDPSFTHENRRGDVIAKTNASGALTYQASYEAYGTRTQENGSTQDRQKANTKDEDPTGLLNEGFRYRDLETGGFITADPAGFINGPNLYTYVKQNPWTSFDPEGLSLLSTVQGMWNSYVQQQTQAAAAEVQHYERDYAHYESHFNVANARNNPMFNVMASGYEAKNGLGIHPENAGKTLSGGERFAAGLSAGASFGETVVMATLGTKALKAGFSPSGKSASETKAITDDTITVYHGTNSSSAPALLKNGPDPEFKRPGDVFPAGGFSVATPHGAEVTGVGGSAQDYARGTAAQYGGDPVMLVMRMPRSIYKMGAGDMTEKRFETGTGLEALRKSWSSIEKHVTPLPKKQEKTVEATPSN